MSNLAILFSLPLKVNFAATIGPCFRALPRWPSSTRPDQANLYYPSWPESHPRSCPNVVRQVVLCAASRESTLDLDARSLQTLKSHITPNTFHRLRRGRNPCGRAECACSTLL